MTKIKRKQHKVFHLTQRLDKDYWLGWDDKELSVIGDLKKHTDVILSRLRHAGVIVEEMYSIYHDKDSKNVWNEFIADYEKQKAEKHIHVLFKLKAGVDINDIALIIGVKATQIDLAKKGRYTYSNMLAYLIHAKDSDKHLYSIDEVYTALGDRYEDIYAKEQYNWNLGRKQKEEKFNIDKLSSDDLDELLVRISEGEFSETQIKKTNSLKLAYIRNGAAFEKAFALAAEKKSELYKKRLSRGEIKKINVYLYGAAGVGKTRFANELSEVVREKIYYSIGEVWSTVKLAAKNGLDQYSSEEIIILDDIRGDSFNFNEILRLLDPHNLNVGAARYKNKIVQYRLAIITAPEKPDRTFTTKENINQLMRRLGDHIYDVDSEQFKDEQQRKKLIEKITNEILEQEKN